MVGEEGLEKGMVAYPAVHFIVLARAPGVRDLVFRVVAFHKVLHDGAALEEADGRAVREDIGQCGDAAVGVNFEEPGLLLLILAEVDGGDLTYPGVLDWIFLSHGGGAGWKRGGMGVPCTEDQAPQGGLRS